MDIFIHSCSFNFFSGIGYYTALDLAKRNARVILACRDEVKAESAKNKIIAASNNKNVVVRVIDLCVMRSVKDFARQIISEETRLDVLINNAGIVSKFLDYILF